MSAKQLSSRLISRTAIVAVVAAGVLMGTAGPSWGADAFGTIKLNSSGEARVMVTLKDADGSSEIREATRRVKSNLAGDLRRVRTYRHIPVIAVTADAPGLARLEKHPDVAAVREVGRAKPQMLQSVPLVSAPYAWGLGYTGTSQAIAVIDTGVDSTIPSLAGKVIEEACFDWEEMTCPDETEEMYGEGAAQPCEDFDDEYLCSHGTEMASVATSSDLTYRGVAPTANIIAARVMETYQGFALEDDVIAAMDWVIELSAVRSIPAVLMSLADYVDGSYDANGTCDTSQPAYKEAIDALRAAGIAPVIASGNDSEPGYPEPVGVPGCVSTAVTVGSTTKSNALSSFSNSGASVDLLAPGEAISMPSTLNRLHTGSGTSYAAAHVAGAFALIRSAHAARTVTDIRNALANTGLTVSDPRNTSNAKRINVQSAINSLDQAPKHRDSIGVYRNAFFSLRNSNYSGMTNVRYEYGLPTSAPAPGDWDNNGTDTAGVYHAPFFYLRNSNSPGTSNYVFEFGLPGDVPLVGNWDGIGGDGIGVWRNGWFYLRNSLSAGPANYAFAFGNPTDIPIAGDWNNDGRDSIGLYRGPFFILRNPLSTGPAEAVFEFGLAGDKPVVGDWNADGWDGVGVRRGAYFFLKNGHGPGAPDFITEFGLSGDKPVAGNWDGI